MLLSARIRDAFGDVFAVFRKYDANRRGFLTAKEIRAVLEDLYLYVSDKQLEELLLRYASASSRASHVTGTCRLSRVDGRQAT